MNAKSTLQRFAILACVASAAALGHGGASAAGADSAKGGAKAGGKPTIVLVHGAFADSTSWDKVTTRLVADGYTVIAAANPLRGVASDGAYVGAIVKSIPGPVVLVGHSYGGNVITAAVGDNQNVKALVYVAGFAADVGESAATLGAKFPGGTLGPTLAPPVPLPGGAKDLYIQQSKFHAQFAADLPAKDAVLMAVDQRPITEAALNENSAAAPWKTIPSYFIYGKLDKNIPAAAHAYMAQRAKARQTIAVDGASHVVMMSHAPQVAKMIEDAAKD
jgi:pimeloyl-ACP methyl ester carboxylesterase